VNLLKGELKIEMGCGGLSLRFGLGLSLVKMFFWGAGAEGGGGGGGCMGENGGGGGQVTGIVGGKRPALMDGESGERGGNCW